MRKQATFAVLLILSICTTAWLSACTKESDPEPPVIAKPLSKDEILVQKSWQVDELHHVINSKYTSYVRNKSNNTGTNYDVLRFTFKADGTGTHVDASGTSLPITWQFVDGNKRTIRLVLNGSTNYTWNMVEIAENFLHATAAPLIVAGNPDNVEAFRLIQVP